MDRKPSLGIVQAILGIVALFGLLSFLIREPKPIGWSLRLVSTVAAVGYLKVDEERRAIESGERELDRIAQGWEELKAAQQQFQANCELEIANVQSAYRERYAEIQQEWNTIAQEKQAIEIIRKELEETFQRERAAIALEKQQQEGALAVAREQHEKALTEAKRLQDELLAAEWQRVEQIGIEVNTKALTQEIALRQDREQHQIEMQQLRLELADRERAVTIAEGKLRLRQEELETEYAAKVAKIQIDQLSKHQELYEELQHEAEKVRVEQDLLDDDYNRKMLELQNALQETRNELRAAQETYERQEQEHQDRVFQIYAEREQEFNQFRDATVSQINAEWEQSVNQANAYISSLMTEIESLRAQVAEFLIAQEFPRHKGPAAYYGNQVLEELRAYDGIVVEPHECMVVPGRGTAENPAVVVWLRLGEGVRPEVVFGLRVALAHRLHRTDVTMTIDAQGFLAIGFGDVAGAIQVPNGDAVIEDKNKREPIKKTEPSAAALADAFDHSSMYAVLGPTGAGKSSLVNNLLSRASASLGGAKVTIVDMKYPDPDTLWKILGQEVIPQYCDFEADECLDGVKDMAAHFLARKRRRLQDARAKRPITRFERSLWVIDEAPTLIDTYKTALSIPLKLGVRVARGLDGKVCIIGQTPRVSDYGLKIPDMMNFSRFYLGAEFAALGLKEITCSPRVKQRILAEIYYRQELAEKQIAEGDLLPNGKPSEMYFALVATQSGQVFLMTMPAPNAWENWDVAELGEEPLVKDEELIPVSDDDLNSLMEEAARKEAEEEAKNNPQPASSEAPAADQPEQPKIEIDTSGMSQLQQEIVRFCIDRRGEMFCFSDFNAKDQNIRKIVNRIADEQTAPDRLNKVKTKVQGGKAATKVKTVNKSAIVKDACLDLIRTHKFGSMHPNGRRFGLMN